MSSQKIPYIENVKVSLICSALTLHTWNPISGTNIGDIRRTWVAVEEYKLNYFLLNYVSIVYKNKMLQEIIWKLLQILFKINRGMDGIMKEQDVELFRQYLRKFAFFYRYYYLNNYPNDFSELSAKKINVLAVKSLFLIYGL